MPKSPPQTVPCRSQYWKLLGLLHRLAALLPFLFLACGESGEAPSPTPPSEVKSPQVPAKADARGSEEIFLDQATEAGVDFVHWNGMTNEFYYSEHMGGGAALFDYDGDGDLDLYLTQGHLMGPGKKPEDARFPAPEGAAIDRLYRNDLEVLPSGERRLHFTDVTEQSGLVVDRYSIGVAVGDVDNDGWPDLYVTHWNSANQLFRNQGIGADGHVTFEEIGVAAGVDEKRWSIAAVFFDYDLDGWLDLYIGNYLDYSFAAHKECVNDIGRRDYCGPVSFKPLPDVLFRNRGAQSKGRILFEDVSSKAGIVQDPAPVLGAISGDFDGDGWLDLYLANDEFPNNLLLNEGGTKFRDEALLAGAAMSSEGKAEAGMGVDAGDFDNDGDEDLFIAHLNQETNTLYRNQGGLFGDDTIETGLGSPSFDFTGFGAGFLDYDNDGWLDVLVVNGAVQGIRSQMLAGDPYPMHQTNQLFRNLGDGSYEEVSANAGAAFELSEVSRGAAFGDLDNDGDTDVVVHNNAGPVRLLVNQVGARQQWVGVRVLGESGRDMVGSWVELLTPGPPQGRRVRTEGSYASANDPRVLFGLGGATGLASGEGTAHVRVTWPDGQREEWQDLPFGQYTTLRQGEGSLASTP